MVPSPIGIALCVVLYLIGRRTNDALIASMLLAIPFGSTAVATISSFGGATPPIYLVFVALTIFAALGLRNFPQYFGMVIRSNYVGIVLLGLMIYAAAGSYILPRLFLGEATIFQVSRDTGHVDKTLLGPVTYNVTQTVFFLAGAAAYFAISVLLLRRRGFDAVKFGFFGAALINSVLGLIDLGGKLAGLGDVLGPLRTANYAMITEDVIGSFYRIGGGFPEASAFAGATLMFLAFTAMYWRETGSVKAGLLSLLQAALLLLSTSSTAYVGFAVLVAFWLLASARLIVVEKSLAKRDLMLTLLALVGLAIVTAVAIYNDNLLLPAKRLFETMVLNKATSESAIERGAWNSSSLEALMTSGGLGIGLGTSRTSSWIVATLAHLGIPGAVMVAALVYFLIRGLRGIDTSALTGETVVLVNCVRVAALAALSASAVAGPTADPGLPFFLALAVTSVARISAARVQPERSESGSSSNPYPA